MTENEAIEFLKGKYPSWGCDEDEYENAQTAIQALEEIQAYRAIGTVEEIQQKLAELDRWHTSKVNEKIKNPFAYTSTSICHNCDHKDEYIEELEAELEKMKPRKVVEVDGLGETEYRCPSCSSLVAGLFCNDCGQALDWSE